MKKLRRAGILRSALGPRGRRRLWLPLLLAAAASGMAIGVGAQVSTEPITVSVIGDVPYGSSEISDLANHVDDHNLFSSADFLVHLGDILSGSESCQEERYQTVAILLEGLAVPAFIVPGDNEWTDCSNASQGWAWWETHLLGLEQRFCGAPEVDSQLERPENFAFLEKGVLFIGVNMVSGTPSAVVNADADWVDAQFAAKGDAVRAAVIFAQKEPSGALFDAVVSSGATFAKPVLYIHGNGHSWEEDPGYFGQPDMLRVQVPRGSSSNPPVHVTVDAAGNFHLERDPWPGGTPVLNQPPCVDAGADLEIDPSGAAQLDALYSDDGVPSSGLATTWLRLTGPGSVSFADETSPTTTATFSAPGLYTLAFRADDGELVTEDALQVTVGSATPLLVVDDAVAPEGGTARFAVTLLSPDGSPVMVDYFTGDDTAVAPGDYTPQSGTLGFDGGTTQLEVSVAVHQDGLEEAVEGFRLILTNPSGAAISDPEGIASILDDDALPPSNFTVAFLGDQGLGADAEAVLQLVLAEGADALVLTGGFDHQDDPAAWEAQIDQVLGPDFPVFAAAGGPDAALFHAPGGYRERLEARMARVGIPWLDDLGTQSAFSYGGIFFVLTAPGVFGAGDGFHDDYVRERLAENESVWRVSGWHKNMSALQVGGAADETGWGVYEESRRGGAIIATAHSHTYSRTHLLSHVPSQEVAGASGALALAADDPFTPEDEGRSFAFVSGLGGLGVESQLADGPWWASVHTADQGAAPGALFGVFHHEGDPELAHFYFRDVTGAVADSFFAASSLRGGAPRILIDDAQLAEGDAGTAELVFGVQLVSPGVGDVAVDYATADGTATAGVDYQPTSGQLVFSGGATFHEIRVTVNGDLDPEADETFDVVLANPSGAVLSRTRGIGTLLDDDAPEPAPELAFAPVADAKVSSKRPDRNYGADVDLRIKSSSTVYHSYLLFDLDTGGAAVSSAVLRLHANDAAAEGGSFFATGTGWSEDTITWNGAPPPAGPALASLGSVAAGEVVEVDVSAAVTGGGPVAFYLESADSSSTYYSSREGAVPPELVVTTGAPPPPSPPPPPPPPPTPPTADFAASPTSGPAPLDVAFTDASSGAPDTWSWQFGDGGTSTAQHPTHAYQSAGSYTVTLTASNAEGSDTAVHVDYVTAEVPPPIATFTPVGDAHVKLSAPSNNYGTDTVLRVKDGSSVYESYLQFDVQGLAGPVSAATLRLFLPDAGSDGGGVHAVTSDWSEATITAGSAPAIAGPPLASVGSVAHGTWVELDVTAGVSGPGLVSFAIANDVGTSTYYASRESATPPELVVTAGEPPPPVAPTADFTASPTSGAAPLSVAFTDTSSGSPDTWSWDFGDGGSSLERHPSHEYAAPGSYDVTLSVSNGLGADAVTKTGVVVATEAPAVVTLAAAADAKVSERKPTSNYGGDLDLRVKQSAGRAYHSHVRFDVPALAGPVVSATLKLWVDDPSGDGGSVFATASGWGESTVTWENAPALSGAPLGSIDAGAAGVYAEVDVTSAVSGAGPVGFGISGSASNSAYYSSREGAHPPLLVIESAAGP